jgi:hypothetical protein
MSSIEAKASELGIPMKMVVDDGLRYRDCDAHEATLVSVEGGKAIYRGVCFWGHRYEMEYLVSELQAMAHIENGEIVYGEEATKRNPLEEYS